MAYSTSWASRRHACSSPDEPGWRFLHAAAIGRHRQPSGYRLAPAFDLVPDVVERREHTVSFQFDYGCPTREILLAIGKQWRVVRAEDCVDDVVQAVSTLRATARKLAVRRGKGLDLIAADAHPDGESGSGPRTAG